MQVIIPAGGLGTRMRPHTHSKPKPLVPVGGKPSIAHILDALSVLPIEKIVLITGRGGQLLLDYVKQKYPFPAVAIEQKVMRGQSDAILLAEPEIDPQSDLFVVFSDTLFEADLLALQRLGAADGAGFVKEVPDPSRFGIAVSDAQGFMTRLVEKPEDPLSHDAVVGLYYFKRAGQIYAAIHEQMERGIMLKNEYFLADAIQVMIDQGAKIKVLPVTVWEDTGTRDAILHSNRYLLRKTLASGPQEPYIQGSALIVPPVFVSPDATLEHSVIGPYVSIGAGVVIVDSVVRDSIVGDQARVRAAILSGSLIGDRAVVEGSYQIANIGDDSALQADLGGAIDETFK
ncbi:MAG TPA: sugar phosphate nucleotidyltransferase [Chloroflexia bacterium]|nr:sugar phosphate nucleotidyltransferase [Chloroflexia bacterium]